MEENSVSENTSNNGNAKRIMIPGLALVAGSAALAAGLLMRNRINVAAFRERFLPETWKTSEAALTDGESDDEEE